MARFELDTQVMEQEILKLARESAVQAVRENLDRIRAMVAEEFAQAVLAYDPCEKVCHPPNGCCGGVYKRWAEIYAEVIRQHRPELKGIEDG